MKTQTTRSSRLALVFVTINLALTLAFLVAGSANVKNIRSTLAAHDELIHQWFSLRLAIADARSADSDGHGRDTIAVASEFAKFSSMMDAALSSPAIAAASRLSVEISGAMEHTRSQWARIRPDLQAGTDSAISPQSGDVHQMDLDSIDAFQLALLESQVVLGRFVGTQEHAFSILLYCLGGTVFLIVAIFVMVEAENERARRRALRTRLLTQSTLRGQELERARIARSLHDSLAQELSLAALETELLSGAKDRSPRETEVLREKLNGRLRRAVDWVRNLAYELRPAEIDSTGLAAAITSFCEDRSATAGFALTWQLTGEVDHLDPDCAICIYRIAQECVTNAIRHSHATRVNLGLHGDDRQIQLTVTDDGVGVDHSSSNVTRRRHGLGIAGMEERAQMMGGTLEVTSPPGGGTTVRLSVPAGACAGDREDQ